MSVDLMKEIDECLNTGIEVYFCNTANPNHRMIRLTTFLGEKKHSVSKVWDVEHAKLSTFTLTAVLIKHSRLELIKFLDSEKQETE